MLSDLLHENEDHRGLGGIDNVDALAAEIFPIPRQRGTFSVFGPAKLRRAISVHRPFPVLPRPLSFFWRQQPINRVTYLGLIHLLFYRRFSLHPAALFWIISRNGSAAELSAEKHRKNNGVSLEYARS